MMRKSRKSKVQEAEEFGIDITLLYGNLDRTPEERLENLESMLCFVETLRTAKAVKESAKNRNDPSKSG